jgi:hypothetical protein
MKKSIILLSLLSITAFFIAIYSCKVDSKETCQQDEICTSKFVSACCTNDVCTYTYDGKEYSEDEIDQLAKDLGCGGSALSYKSAGDLQSVVVRLKELMSRVRCISK